MQKWEYQVLYVIANSQGRLALVESVNGNDVSVPIPKKGLLGADRKYIALHEYLSQVGAEGWKAVGLAPAGIAVSSGLVPMMLLLERPCP